MKLDSKYCNRTKADIEAYNKRFGLDIRQVKTGNKPLTRFKVFEYNDDMTVKSNDCFLLARDYSHAKLLLLQQLGRPMSRFLRLFDVKQSCLVPLTAETKGVSTPASVVKVKKANPNAFKPKETKELTSREVFEQQLSDDIKALNVPNKGYKSE